MTNAILHIFSELESHEFSAELNVVSGLRQAAEFLRDHKTVKRLCAHLTSDVTTRSVVLERLLWLTRQAVDPAYESPHDAAITAYLAAVNMHDASLGLIAAAIAAGARQTWWAKKVSQELLTGRSLWRSAETAAATEIVRLTPPVDMFASTQVTARCGSHNDARFVGLLQTVGPLALAAAAAVSIVSPTDLTATSSYLPESAGVDRAVAGMRSENQLAFPTANAVGPHAVFASGHLVMTHGKGTADG